MKLLTSKAPGAIKKQALPIYRNKVVAVDATIVFF